MESGEVNGSSLLSKCRRVGLLYDNRMCKHTTPNGEDHPENPNRIISIWNKLKSSGITNRCVVMKAKEADEHHIALVHTKSHINLIKDISSKKFNPRRKRIAAGFDSIYFNEGSSEAASLAAGSVIEVAEKVANGELDSAFAIVRPPGHHAEEDEPMGFCLYNNVAVAASFILDVKPELSIKKILIVDWDVHHGNGTQNKFWKDPRVLLFSVHRHGFGSFYPGGDDGFYTMTGEGPGAGYNINVPWENDSCGDADYLAVWNYVLIPVAEAFDPDLVMISAGFDAAIGDPLGCCCVTSKGYALMLSKLMKFAGGKIVMALEGGYNLSSTANSTHACLDVLLYDKPIPESPKAYPFESTWRVIHEVRNELSTFWPVLAKKLPEKVTSKKIPYVQTSNSEFGDGELLNDLSSLSGNHETDIKNVIRPLLNLELVLRFSKPKKWENPVSVNSIPKPLLASISAVAASSSATPGSSSSAPVLIPRKERVKSSSGTVNVYGLAGLRDEDDDAFRPTDILAAELAHRGEGKKRKYVPSSEERDTLEGVKIKVKAKQTEARGEKRPRQTEPEVSVEEVAHLAEKSQTDLVKEMRKLAFHATQLSKDFALRAKDPNANPDLWRQENEKLKAALYEAQSKLERYKGQSTENERLKTEVDGLAKDLAAERAEKEKLVVDLKARTSDLEAKTSDLEAKTNALKKAVEKAEGLELDLDVVYVRLEQVPQQIEDAKWEFLKSRFVDDNLTVVMQAAISGGYTTAISECKARDALFDHVGLESAELFNPAAPDVFDERFVAFQNGVDLCAPCPAPTLAAETAPEDVITEISPEVEVNIVDDPVSSDLPGFDPLQSQS